MQSGLWPFLRIKFKDNKNKITVFQQETLCLNLEHAIPHVKSSPNPSFRLLCFFERIFPEKNLQFYTTDLE